GFEHPFARHWHRRSWVVDLAFPFVCCSTCPTLVKGRDQVFPEQALNGGLRAGQLDSGPAEV
ncbi:unnamed protein product, partial [Pylaiella littoralis]